MSEYFQVSEGQKPFFFYQQAFGGNPVYNVGYFWVIEGKFDFTRFEQALSAVVTRHAILQRTYHWINNEVQSKARRFSKPPFERIEVSVFGEEEKRKWIHNQTQTPIDLENEPPYRWTCVFENGRARYLSVVYNHICADLWSHMILMDELRSAYIGEELPPSSKSYDHFIREQNQWLKTDKAEKQLQFWKTKFSKGQLLNLPTDHQRPARPVFQTEIVTRTLGENKTTALKACADSNGVSLFALCLAAYQLLLHRYTGQNNFFVGAPSAGRSGNAYLRTFGYFVNTLAYIADFDGVTTFADYLKQLNKEIRLSLRNKDYPSFSLNNSTRSGQSLSHPALFQTAFGWEEPNHFLHREQPMVTQQESGRECWDMRAFSLVLEKKFQITEFDQVLRIANNGAVFKLDLEYNAALFDRDTIAHFIASYLVLLNDVIENPQKPVQQLRLIDEQQINILQKWGSGKITPKPSVSFPQLIHDWAKNQPDQIALYSKQQHLTYKQLDEKTNQIAHYLRQKNITAGTPIGLWAPSGLYRILGLLAIQKLACPYVALDPAYPKERLRWIAEDARIGAIIGVELPIDLHTRLPVIDIAASEADWTQLQKTAPTPPASSDDLAYIIYTSGSTGTPKGVPITHTGLVNLINSLGRSYALKPGISVLQLGSLNFDISIMEIGMCLGNGGTLCVAEQPELLPGPNLINTIKSLKVNVLLITPSALAALPVTQLDDLQLIVVGGEACSASLVNQWGKGRRFFNAYGPTEVCIAATTGELKAGLDKVTLGEPLDNLSLYVLDQYRQTVPPGAIGELYVGGFSLSKGYLNQDELNAQVFIDNPFAAGTLYKTGDLVRYACDGQLSYHGRSDQQIKVRGFRIEPGEIESCLAKLQVIREVKVIDNPPGKQLVAYIIAQGELPSSAVLKRHLAMALPPQMIPSRFIEIDSLPLTANGKIDHEALPLASEPMQHKSHAWSADEEVVCRIWALALQHDVTDKHVNFFDAGGDSLSLVSVHRQLCDTFEKEIDISLLFQYSTIEEMAALFEGSPIHHEETELHRQSHPFTARDIAIIGMAGRFPGAASIDELWELLLEGRSGIRLFTKEELEKEGVSATLLNDDNYVPSLGYLEDATCFEADFFGYSPREAALMDPQHRLFLQTAWQALEDAGIDPYSCNDTIGVYGGCGANGYLQKHLLSHPELFHQMGSLPLMIGNEKDFLCNRVSYKLNLNGPAVVVQSACSTSLTAVHYACQALLEQECHVALAGGVSVIFPGKSGYLYQEGSISSPDGACRPFDASANGMVPGQGVALVVLKPLEKALQDGDSIHAVIKGSAINNDGSAKIGYTAPGVYGQSVVLQSALAASGLSASDISYIEAHGTATPLGDPIEMTSLSHVYGGRARKTPCIVGSVKSNIGHLDAAAGVAGLIKAALSLEKEAIPGTLHFRQYNPKIDMCDGAFTVTANTTEWPRTDRPRAAAVSSFGLGGTNAHVILQEAPLRQPQATSEPPAQLLVLSASSEEALDRQSESLVSHFRKHPELSLAHIANTLQKGRHHFRYRRSLSATNLDEAIYQLTAHAEYAQTDGHSKTLCFLFPGQGTQYLNMGRQLYECSDVYRHCLERIQRFYLDTFDFDLLDVMFSDDTEEEAANKTLQQTQYTQPALYATEYALAMLWQSIGVTPSAMVGHSIGEYVAATLAGVFSLEDALTLVFERGRLIQSLAPGSMLSVRLSEAEAEPLLHPDISLAAINGPKAIVLAGAHRAIEQLTLQLQDKGIPYRRLHTSHAFHSHLIDPILADFRAVVEATQRHTPRPIFISTRTGDWADDKVTSTDYWVDQLRHEVRFNAAARRLVDRRHGLYLEVGPGQVLSTLLQQQPQLHGDHPIMHGFHKTASETSYQQWLETVGKLWEAGIEVDFSAFNKETHKVHLPGYPFARTPYLIEPYRDNHKVLVATDPVRLITENAATCNTRRKTNEEISSNPLLSQLTALWASFLGLDSVAEDDDFFALGGDSLLAINLTVEIETAFHIELGTHSLIQHPTPRGLLQIISAKLKNPSLSPKQTKYDFLVTLNDASHPVPIFLFPTGGGMLLIYSDLVRALGKEHAVYGFKAGGLDGKTKPFTSIPEMASAFADELERFYPHGPMIFGGASFGGMVAYETASILEKRGRTVDLIFLVDSPGKHFMPTLDDTNIAVLKELVGESLQLDVEALSTMSDEQQIDYVRDLARKAEKKVHLPPEFGVPFLKVTQAHRKAMHSYQADGTENTIVFFKHKETLPAYSKTPEMAWICKAQGSFELWHVDGNHYTMNQFPHVQMIAQVIAMRASQNQLVAQKILSRRG